MKTWPARAAIVALFLASLSIPTTSFGQYPMQQFDYRDYPPIEHDVPFHPQDTMVWCWVAVAKMLAEFQTGGPIESQCEMLELQYAAPCCQQPALCMRPGHILEVGELIRTFGGRTSQVSRPADGFALYSALRRGPIVMHTTQGSGHFIVATGMRVEPTPYGPLGIVSINDPFYGPREVDFPTLIQFWSAALLVY